VKPIPGCDPIFQLPRSWISGSPEHASFPVRDYGDLIFTVAASFKSRQAQAEDGGYGCSKTSTL